MIDVAQTDIATLRKFVTLDPVPVEAKWSVSKIGADDDFGPTDTALWAVVRYADADLPAVSQALKAEPAPRAAPMGSPPAWLLADVDLARFRRGPDHVFEGAVSSAKPFASDLYSTGFALVLPDRRVLIHFSSR